jgi:endonuclease YncB( thermonuclease family)
VTPDEMPEMPELPALGWLGTPAPSGMSAPAEFMCGRCQRPLSAHNRAKMPDGRVMATCADGRDFSVADYRPTLAAGHIDHLDLGGDHTYGVPPGFKRAVDVFPRAVAQSLSEFVGHRFEYLNVTWRAWYLQESYDSDTPTVRCDRGWYDTSTMSIRLLGVDCYEVASGPAELRAIGVEARDWMRAEMARCGSDIQLDTVLVANKQDPREKYGRFLARGTYLDGGTLKDMATELRKHGYHKKSSTIEAVPPWPSALPKTLIAGVHYAVREP